MRPHPRSNHTLEIKTDIKPKKWGSTKVELYQAKWVWYHTILAAEILLTNVLLIGIIAILLSACATHTIKTTTYTPIVQSRDYIPEELLLDVGVTIMDAGLDEVDFDDDTVIDADIRIAEARYSTFLLADTLQRSANWGIVYLLPLDRIIMDVYIDGTINLSNGEEMQLQIAVRDSTGREWYNKLYTEVISKFSYEQSERKLHDPFQVIYNKIANDLLAFRNSELSNTEITNIRSISEIQFAQDFAPDAFNKYISQDRNGYRILTSLPAEGDPLLSNIRTIRERDYMFIDTVQDYYVTYTRQMRNSYDSWRELAYNETVSIRELDTAALRRKLIGGALIVAGAATAIQGGNYATQAGGAGIIGIGATIAREGFNKGSEAEMRKETLRELNESFANDVVLRTIAIEDRTVTLTGNIEEQYSQWREILSDMYALETNPLDRTHHIPTLSSQP